MSTRTIRKVGGLARYGAAAVAFVLFAVLFVSAKVVRADDRPASISVAFVPGSTVGHALVGIERNGVRVWYHEHPTVPMGDRASGQLARAVRGVPGKFEQTVAPSPSALVATVPVSNADARRAGDRALAMSGPNRFRLLRRDCVAGARSVLGAAGMRPPAWIRTPASLQRWAQSHAPIAVSSPPRPASRQ